VAMTVVSFRFIFIGILNLELGIRILEFTPIDVPIIIH